MNFFLFLLFIAWKIQTEKNCDQFVKRESFSLQQSVIWRLSWIKEERRKLVIRYWCFWVYTGYCTFQEKYIYLLDLFSILYFMLMTLMLSKQMSFQHAVFIDLISGSTPPYSQFPQQVKNFYFKVENQKYTFYIVYKRKSQKSFVH